MSTRQDRIVADVELTLNDTESTLKRILLDVANFVDADKPSQLRFTGGWVRDKLLGVGSHDIDVAIDNMTGFQFGLKMKEYLEIPGNSIKYGIQGVDKGDGQANDIPKADAEHLVSGLHKIAANPEKSKHLETVTTRIVGLDIDLVNLRKETYTEDSRNPQMEFGTPEEDALRRDATINSMFYNLQTRKVEDLTGRGFDDMQSKIIRTPLEPYQTFKDDPLRVLRLVRFASRLNYSIEPAVEQSMRDDTIKEALKLKISRERVGVEVEKMLRGPRPRMALALLDQLGLYTTVFMDPTVKLDFKPDITSWHLAYDTIDQIVSGRTSALPTILLYDAEQQYVAWILSAFVPFADAPLPSHHKTGGKPPPPLAVSAARESIKATNKICDILALALRNMEEITSIKDAFLRHKATSKVNPDLVDPSAADTLGMAIRRWGPSWLSQVVFTLMVEVNAAKDDEYDVLSGYERFLVHVRKLELLTAYDLKPVIDGKALAKALDTRPGPWMKDALDVVIAWQLRHPDQATAEAAINAVRNSQSELTLALIRHMLQLTIRPLFAKTPPEQITAQGRAALPGTKAPRKLESVEEETTFRPWKRANEAYALQLLGWIVRSLDSRSTELFWPLLIPPILTLLDDTQTKYKGLGCTFLSALLSSTSQALLARTGLGNVLHDATTPCLTYLPSLTPEADSITLLDVAYPALLKLIRVRDGVTESNSTPRPNTITSLTNIMHNHLLTSLTFTIDSHPRLATALLRHLRTLVLALGTATISQLSSLLPLLSTVLSTPLAAAAHPPLLAKAARAMQAVLACAWPRAVVWRGEVLLGACAAWLQIVEVPRDSLVSEFEQQRRLDLDCTEKELILLVQMLISAVAATDMAPGGNQERVDMQTELRLLSDANNALAGLFIEIPPKRG